MQHPFSKSILIVLLLCAFFVHSQTNPEQWFDNQYTQAIEFCEANYKLIDSSLTECCVPTNMALAIVFPEMLRYSLWRDVLETAALELLYVNKGQQVADFSIGWMQMKPSFAELLENKIRNDSLLLIKYRLLAVYRSSEITTQRKERVARLKNFKWQLNYLSAFVDINCKELQKNNIPYNEFLSYLAAAYNRGMNLELESLVDFNKTKTFPYGPGRKNPFGYYEVARYFYIHQNLPYGISQNLHDK